MAKSNDQPIVVDFIKGIYSGSLGLSFVPGKVQQRALYGPWNRHLDSDLDVLVAEYQVDVIYCLCTRDELDELRISKIFQKTRSRRMEIVHFPVTVGKIPDIKDANEFVKSCVNYLNDGKCVVICSCGGLSRAPIFAAYCLSYLMPQEESKCIINLVRSARSEAFPLPKHESAVSDWIKVMNIYEKKLPCDEDEKGVFLKKKKKLNAYYIMYYY